MAFQPTNIPSLQAYTTSIPSSPSEGRLGSRDLLSNGATQASSIFTIHSSDQLAIAIFLSLRKTCIIRALSVAMATKLAEGVA